MACPTCSATMASIGYCNGGTIYHCERCGTVMHRGEFIDPPKVYVPALVERCRRFEAEVWTGSPGNYWHTLGIAEAINTPEERPS